MKNFFLKNWFLIGIAVMLVVGFLLPEVGVAMNRGSIFSTILIVLLFLISGLKLPSESILSGIRNVKLHATIQIFIFVLYPLYFYLTARLFSQTLDGTLIIGLYALACLPTTISSCIVFTQSAEGNTVATMFNAALANVVGIFISPLLLSLLLRSTGAGIPIDELIGILRNLALKMLVPIAAGQVARRAIKPWIDKNKKRLSALSNLFILFIIFFAFAKTASNPEFAERLDELPLPFLYLAITNLLFLGLAYAASRLFMFPRGDMISMLFTAPQKTLGMGVPLLTTFFAANPAILGQVLLPVVFYHSWQLLVAGVLLRFLEPKRAPEA